jgi:hypothetical protein
VEIVVRLFLTIIILAAFTCTTLAQVSGVPPEVVVSLDTNVDLMNKQAPIEINPLQKMVHVSRNAEVILYEIETAVSQDKWTQEMRNRPAQETTKVMCDGKETRLLLNYGFQIRYLIHDAAGLYVTSFVVSKEKCIHP